MFLQEKRIEVEYFMKDGKIETVYKIVKNVFEITTEYKILLLTEGR